MQNEASTNEESFIDISKIINILQVEQGMKIADLGCGHTGHFLFPFAKLVGEKGLVYGVDVLKPALQNIENKAKFDGLTNVRTVWSNLEIFGATKIDNESVDAIIIINILYQVKDRKVFLKEADRILKKGGKAIIVDWLSINAPMGPDLSLRVKKEEVLALAEEVGWKKAEEFSVGKYNFGIKFEK